MSTLKVFDKIVFFFNSLFALGLLIGYILPLIPPHYLPALAVLTLGIPVLILINLFFLIYWLFRLKRQFMLSGLVLILGFFQNATLYKFSGSNQKSKNDDIKILSYNIRLFNANENLGEGKIADSIWNFIEKEDPSIVCFQEYVRQSYIADSITPSAKYPYRYIEFKDDKKYFGQAIFSKYPIVNKGSLNFKRTNNNAIYADLDINNDTIRVYNLHMQSLSLNPQISGLKNEDKKKLLGRIGNSFKKQDEQTQIVLSHTRTIKHPIIFSGDFNNTIYSHTYKELKGDKQDAFTQSGKGFGRTFVFDFIPIRIDYILPDTHFKVIGFNNYDVEYSDHYPIMATLRKD